MQIITSHSSFGKQILELLARLHSVFARRIVILGLSGALLRVLAGGLAIAQNPPPTPTSGQKMQASLPHLYWHFLIFQSHLDGAAAQSEKEGKDGTWLRDHLQRQLNFSDAQFDCVRTSAQHLASQLSDLDAQVKAIIAADYARNPPSPANPKWSRPIAPEIKELTRQREALIQAEVSRLQTALGPQAAGQLDDYLHNTFARNVTVQKFPPHPDPEAVRQQLQNLQRKAAQK